MSFGTISKRARLTPPSPIRKLAPLADQAKRQGTKIYHLNIGQPDIHSPESFLQAVKEFHQDIIAYEPSQGSSALCGSWAKQMSDAYELDLAAKNFLITTGTSEALIFAFIACCDPQDEIIIFDPTYANYRGFSSIAGIELVPVRTELENGFHLPVEEEITKRISKRTRAILICNPNNPTGTVYSREEMQMLINICKDKNLFLIVDETYREFVYDGIKPFCVFELPDAKERTIVVDSLSKRYSLCGARIGALITYHEEILAVTGKMAQVRLLTATIEQYAAAYMIEHVDSDFVPRMVIEYAERRDVLIDALSEIRGVKVFKPQGAFYAVARLPVMRAENFCSYLLSGFSYDGATTFLAPAAGFYQESGRGESEVRVAYVLQKEDLKAAVKIIDCALPEFVKR